jgi:hypothetical protein
LFLLSYKWFYEGGPWNDAMKTRLPLGSESIDHRKNLDPKSAAQTSLKEHNYLLEMVVD